jgi:hypothetical protein
MDMETMDLPVLDVDLDVYIDSLGNHHEPTIDEGG